MTIAICLLVGSIIGAGLILHLAGRKVTAAEIDRREQAQYRSIARALTRDRQDAR